MGRIDNELRRAWQRQRSAPFRTVRPQTPPARSPQDSLELSRRSTRALRGLCQDGVSRPRLQLQSPRGTRHAGDVCEVLPKSASERHPTQLTTTALKATYNSFVSGVTGLGRLVATLPLSTAHDPHAFDEQKRKIHSFFNAVDGQVRVSYNQDEKEIAPTLEKAADIAMLSMGAAGAVRRIGRLWKLGKRPMSVPANPPKPAPGIASRVATTETSASTAVKQLRFPADRHFIRRVKQNTVAKRLNSVVEPGVDVAADVRAINNNIAERLPGGRYLVNGREYGAHNGTLYPVSGAGVHKLSRPAFKALGVLNKFGDTPTAHRILHNMRTSAADRAAALTAHKAGLQ